MMENKLWLIPWDYIKPEDQEPGVIKEPHVIVMATSKEEAIQKVTEHFLSRADWVKDTMEDLLVDQAFEFGQDNIYLSF